MQRKKLMVLALLCTGILTMSTGCSVSSIMDKVVGEAKPDKQDKGEQTEPEKEDVKDVDNNLAKPEFVTDLEGSSTYGKDEAAEALVVEATVSDGGNITYQWYVNNVDSNGGGTPIEGATEAMYTPKTDTVGKLYYFVVATNNLNEKVAKTTSSIVCIDVLESKADSGKWVEDKKGWWYQYADGSYPANEWLKIKKDWYFFDESGYIKTGWFKDGKTWYYFDDKGHMQTGWIQNKKKWYYADENGKIQTGWFKVKKKWYYSDKNGAMQTGWLKDGKEWYYLQKDGSMAVDTTIDGSKIDKSGHWVK